MGHDLAVGVSNQFDVLFGGQRRPASVGHVNLAHFEGRDVAGGVSDDVVVYATEIGTSHFEVIRVLLHLVEVASFIFLQDEGTGASVVFEDVFSLVQVYPLFHYVLGEDLSVIDCQELDERPRSKLEVELDGVAVDGLQTVVKILIDIVAGKS